MCLIYFMKQSEDNVESFTSTESERHCYLLVFIPLLFHITLQSPIFSHYSPKVCSPQGSATIGNALSLSDIHISNEAEME